jgi:hypothetical protein
MAYGFWEKGRASEGEFRIFYKHLKLNLRCTFLHTVYIVIHIFLGLSFNLFFVVFCTLQKGRGKDQLHILYLPTRYITALSCLVNSQY